ncbi:DUF3106 domain-containing protein [Lysobacter niastensis]|uniref:DUF3106 domain-containing protein n=1 Tax=Lysobacter niastensis TaxID=380629 RepID=A0ABS0B3H1_9GAMM|nr:DUF3106 domain-containing protein [Lysobacter niastensis]MBF6023021.1 DUF3106 domain-containing protein [Lysobacter niastensis]
MQPGPDRVRHRPRWARLAALMACLVAGPGLAATAVLGDFADILPNLPAEARVLLQQRAAQWMNWSAGERDAFAVRLKDWEALPAADRGGQRERYAAWRALTPAERTDVQAAMQRYAALPSDEQQALHREFEALDRSQQRGWLLGPLLGADYAVLQPLLAQLPPEEHRAMLQVLRTMAPQQRADLSVLVRRTPPHERAQLRRELQATAPINRDDWLRTRLAR